MNKQYFTRVIHLFKMDSPKGSIEELIKSTESVDALSSIAVLAREKLMEKIEPFVSKMDDEFNVGGNEKWFITHEDYDTYEFVATFLSNDDPIPVEGISGIVTIDREDIAVFIPWSKRDELWIAATSKDPKETMYILAMKYLV